MPVHCSHTNCIKPADFRVGCSGVRFEAALTPQILNNHFTEVHLFCNDHFVDFLYEWGAILKDKVA